MGLSTWQAEPRARMTSGSFAEHRRAVHDFLPEVSAEIPGSAEIGFPPQRIRELTLHSDHIQHAHARLGIEIHQHEPNSASLRMRFRWQKSAIMSGSMAMRAGMVRRLPLLTIHRVGY